MRRNPGGTVVWGLAVLCVAWISGRPVTAGLASDSAGSAGPEVIPVNIANPRVWYVDGYHGGIEGHMPPGSIRDILNELDRKPWWRVSLEIESFSWDHLHSRDPEAYRRLKNLLKDRGPAPRVEIVSGSYSQPFCWAISGESNIRQLVYGIEENRKHFPGVEISTYAVQEPCYTSCLPQILRSLGYKRASLKNFTCWGGYVAGKYNESAVQWVGPDKSAIPASVRYACEGFDGCWCPVSIHPTSGLVDTFVQNGVKYPAGTSFQDAGWPAHPMVTLHGVNVGSRPENLEQIRWVGDSTGRPPHVQYVTWREYFEKVVPAPTTQWVLTQEDIRPGLTWGASVMTALARCVRSAENRMVTTEKLASMAWCAAGTRYPESDLRRGWEAVMLAQHHDSWIVPLGGYGRRRGTWAEQSATLTWNAERICEKIEMESREALAAARQRGKSASQWVRVYNTLGSDRTEVVEVSVALDRGFNGISVYTADGKAVPCQVQSRRRYSGGSMNTTDVLFAAKVPGVGYATYRLEPQAQSSDSSSGARARTLDGGLVEIESDLCRIVLDPAAGGTVKSLIVKADSVEMVDPAAERKFNEYRGYFTNEKRWRSNAESPARVEIVENGPVRVVVQIRGEIGDSRVRTRMTVVQGRRPIDFQVTINFKDGTAIGEEWDGSNTEAVARRPCYDDRFKLQALFPTTLSKCDVYKDAAFDVCKSALGNTFYNNWNDIKNNVVLNWVDVYDSVAGRGMTLFSDHTTSYAFGDGHPLGLVLAWSGKGLWNNTHRIDGAVEAQYAIMPHSGAWEQAGVWSENAGRAEPLVTQVVAGAPVDSLPKSLFSVSDAAVQISALTVENGALVARLFNASPSERTVTVNTGFGISRAEVVELDGRVAEKLAPARKNGRYEMSLAMPGFGIRNVRIVLLPRNGRQ